MVQGLACGLASCFPTARELRMVFTCFNYGGRVKKKEEYFGDMCKLYKIQVSVSINEVLLAYKLPCVYMLSVAV